jgi:hypothetical protein
MSTALETDPRIKTFEVNDTEITARLTDGRSVSIPLHWSWRLEQATPAQRANCRLIGDGEGAHWPDIDEDLSLHGMFYGSPAPRGSRGR